MVFLDYFLYENVKIQSINVSIINYEKPKDSKVENLKNVNKTENKINKVVEPKNNPKNNPESKERKTKEIVKPKRNDVIVSKEVSLDEKLLVKKEEIPEKQNPKTLNQENTTEENIDKNQDDVVIEDKKDDLFDKMIDNMEKDIEKKKEKEDFLKDVGVEEPDINEDQKYELSEENLSEINQQFSQCWFATVGFLNSETEYINLKLHMNINGTIEKIDINESEEKIQDEKFTVLLNQVTRALKNPKCSVLKLPKNEYYKWKIIYMKFKPQRKL